MSDEQSTRGELPLMDYDPRSHLVTPDRTPERARFPVIDFHTHGRGHDPADLVRAMDAVGVERVVDMGVGTGERFDTAYERYVKPYPDRFILFAAFDWDELLQHDDFGERAADALRRCVEKGARGVKFFKNVGLTARFPDGELLRIDDERLNPIIATAGELDIPVCFHTADPPSFHQPYDRHNERYIALTTHPTWHFYGPDFPDRDEILEQRNRVIERFPDVTFIGAHLAAHGLDLPRLAELLDRFPNFYVDTSARIRELGLQPYTARRFCVQYADRILFGTDGPTEVDKVRLFLRFFETEDEHIPFQKLDHMCGLFLPDDVLEKVYRLNAMKLLKLG
ncbi:MAG: amidohydrolase family protein [Armatimonadota bacterium]